jgi:hypothetical protein
MAVGADGVAPTRLVGAASAPTALTHGGDVDRYQADLQEAFHRLDSAELRLQLEEIHLL